MNNQTELEIVSDGENFTSELVPNLSSILETADSIYWTLNPECLHGDTYKQYFTTNFLIKNYNGLD